MRRGGTIAHHHHTVRRRSTFQKDAFSAQIIRSPSLLDSRQRKQKWFRWQEQRKRNLWACSVRFSAADNHQTPPFYPPPPLLLSTKIVEHRETLGPVLGPLAISNIDACRCRSRLRIFCVSISKMLCLCKWERAQCSACKRQSIQMWSNFFLFSATIALRKTHPSSHHTNFNFVCRFVFTSLCLYACSVFFLVLADFRC